MPAVIKRLLSVGIAAVALGAAMTALPARAADVVAVLSNPGASQSSFADEFAAALARHGRHRLVRTTQADADRSSLPAEAIIVAVGADACREAVSRGAPAVLGVFVSDQDARALAGLGASTALTLIVLNQPLGRKLSLIAETVPGARSVGLLLGPQPAARRRLLEARIRRAGLVPHSAEVTSAQQLMPALQRLLVDSDVLLALPDAGIYNRNTVMSILLSSYRHRRPVIGFTASYVRAGALAAVFSSPADIAQQAAEILDEVDGPSGLRTQVLEPAHFHVAVNRRVARSLHLPTTSGDLLAQRLREGERDP